MVKVFNFAFFLCIDYGFNLILIIKFSFFFRKSRCLCYYSKILYAPILEVISSASHKDGIKVIVRFQISKKKSIGTFQKFYCQCAVIFWIVLFAQYELFYLRRCFISYSTNYLFVCPRKCEAMYHIFYRFDTIRNNISSVHKMIIYLL